MNSSALLFLVMGWGIIIFFAVISMTTIIKRSK